VSLFVAGSVASLLNSNNEPLAINKAMIAKINKEKSTWTAGHNDFFEGKTLVDAKRLMGFIPNPDKKLKSVVREVLDLPENFSSITQWPSCPIIAEIFNQADCGSCWAFGCVEAVQDRFCIHKGKNYNQVLSFMEETSCAPCYGCEGGDPDSAWDFVSESGLVTDACYPYLIPTCPPSQQPCLNFVPTPPCESTCNNTENKWVPYVLSTAYDVGNGSASPIAAEIFLNGPVEACFSVYEDFLSYKSGVYQYQSGSLLGGHCIKIIGWGVENGTPYWLCNNSWTTSWGDKGQFKILRGQDECGIEDDVVAGMP